MLLHRYNVPLLLLAALILGAAGCAGVVQSTPTGNPPPVASASFPCASPKIDANGKPESVVILLDGVGSEEEKGTYYPVPVSSLQPSAPEVHNYCPLDAKYHERTDLPSGLNSSLRRWSEFSVPGGSSGGSSPSAATYVCHRRDTSTVPAPVPGPAPGSSQTTPPPITTSTTGGFGQGVCLTEALADAGAVLLPYSYTGAILNQAGVFTQEGYSPDNSRQELCASVTSLAHEVISIHSTWPDTQIEIVGHSLGGLVAETWWHAEHSSTECGIQSDPSGVKHEFFLHSPINGVNMGASGVVHVFSLDSPINGVQRCFTARNVVPAAIGPGAAASTWCALWDGDVVHGALNGIQIAQIDDHELSYTAVGTPNDPAYGGGISTGGGGGLEDQLIYNCLDSPEENDPTDHCIDQTGHPLPVSYPSASAQCDGSSGNVYGTIGHDIVKTCPEVIKLIVAGLQSKPQATSPSSIAGPTSCGSSGFYLSIDAQGLSCEAARRVTNAWASGTANPTCGPDGKVCHVVGFACIVPNTGNSTHLICQRGRERVDAHLSYY
jgi:hypothetical protein